MDGAVLPRFCSVFSLLSALGRRNASRFVFNRQQRRFNSSSICCCSEKGNGPLLVVVGGGAAGVYASVRAKEVAPHLNVLVIEKGKLLSKVRISGGGRCNLTNGNYLEKQGLAGNYPRGNKELQGSYFNIHGPQDTMNWFSSHGVDLKIEEDGRVFPNSNNSASIVDCLLSVAKSSGVQLQTGKLISNACVSVNGKFSLKMEKRTMDLVENIEADYLLIATGSSQQGYRLAVELGHSIINPLPSIFTFKVDDDKLASLSGITLPKVKAKLKLDNICQTLPEYTQMGAMLVTHWGLTGPVVLRLSAWGARDLFFSEYKDLGHGFHLFKSKVFDGSDAILSDGNRVLEYDEQVARGRKMEEKPHGNVNWFGVSPWIGGHSTLSNVVLASRPARVIFYPRNLYVDLVPDVHIEDVKDSLVQHRRHLANQKLYSSFPAEFGLVKRFWRYLLDREGLDGDQPWASLSNKSVNSIGLLLKQCSFRIAGKGQFKDEFVTAGGVPLSEISLRTMESRIQPKLFFAGEVLNIDGITGGFNFQNAWTGGYIAGTYIGELASSYNKVEAAGYKPMNETR